MAYMGSDIIPYGVRYGMGLGHVAHDPPRSYKKMHEI